MPTTTLDFDGALYTSAPGSPGGSLSIMASICYAIEVTLAKQAYATAFRPNGPSVNSQGREPLVSMYNLKHSPNGAKVTFAPLDLYIQVQGLTPLAIYDRRVAAETDERIRGF